MSSIFQKHACRPFLFHRVSEKSGSEPGALKTQAVLIPVQWVMAAISTVDQRQMDTRSENRFIKHIIISVLNWFNLSVLSFLLFVSTALGKQ